MASLGAWLQDTRWTIACTCLVEQADECLHVENEVRAGNDGHSRFLQTTVGVYMSESSATF